MGYLMGILTVIATTGFLYVGDIVFDKMTYESRVRECIKSSNVSKKYLKQVENNCKLSLIN